MNPDVYGIFCLEGEWNPDDLTLRDRVAPLLELLERLGLANTIHRDVATKYELLYYLDAWGSGYEDFIVLYLACHGRKGKLDLGRDVVSFSDLEKQLDGQCAGCVIYFGSCSVLSLYDEELMEFVRRTGAKAVVGFEKPVDWLDSAAFELLVLERLVRDKRSDAFFNHLVRDHGKFARDLGLVAATKSKVYRSVELVPKIVTAPIGR